MVTIFFFDTFECVDGPSVEEVLALRECGRLFIVSMGCVAIIGNVPSQ